MSPEGDFRVSPFLAYEFLQLDTASTFLRPFIVPDLVIYFGFFLNAKGFSEHGDFLKSSDVQQHSNAHRSLDSLHGHVEVVRNVQKSVLQQSSLRHLSRSLSDKHASA